MSKPISLYGGPLDGLTVPLSEDSRYFGYRMENGYPVYEGVMPTDGPIVFTFMGYATEPTEQAWQEMHKARQN